MDPYSQYRTWPTDGYLDQDGIVVGCNQTEEWLLPWWWERYSRKNSHPVTFIDFGMSSRMREWCQKRGILRRLWIPDCFVSEKEEMDSSLFPQWAPTCGVNFWHKRSAWFKKPAACLQSPFCRSIWLDLDCDVRGDLQELFASCNSSRLALANYSTTGALDYNAGVIVFQRGHPLIQEWAHQALDRNRDFGGDQDLLIAIIQEQGWEIAPLPLIYNWSRTFEENPHARIIHWHGDAGKTAIASELTFANLKSLRF